MAVMLTIVALIVIGAMAAGGHSGNPVKYNQQRKWYITFICGVLCIQSGFRSYTVGADSYQYSLMFEHVKLTSWQSIGERISNYYLHGNTMNVKDPGFEFVEKAFQAFGFDCRAWFVFIAILFFSAFGYYLYKNSSRVSDACFAFILYLLLFYGFYSVTGIRQTIAMSCCLWAFEMVKRRKLLPFLVLVLLGSFVHKSALLFIPAFWVYQIKDSRRLLGAMLVLLPVVFVLRSPIVSFFAGLTGYESYAEGYQGAGAYSYAILAVAAAALTWWKADKILGGNAAVGGLINLFAISVAIIPSLWVDPSLMRVIQYYSITILLVFPHILRTLDSELMLRGRGRAAASTHVPGVAAFATSKTGSVYFLCMMFLVAYCCIRFAGYSYSFCFFD